MKNNILLVEELENYSEDDLKKIILNSAYSQEVRINAQKKLQYLVDQKNSQKNPLMIPTNMKYWWSEMNLKNYEQAYPPVKYYGEIITTPGSTGCGGDYGTYNGVFGCYDQQIKEHQLFMKKWYLDNRPGDEFYRDNPFYIKGKDGLPVFNYDGSRRTTPSGFDTQEYPLYLAETNNIETKYQNKINNLTKIKNSDIGRLNKKIQDIESELEQQKKIASAEYYRTGTGTKNYDYDPEGGLGATLKSPTSGGVATGSKAWDNFIKYTLPNANKEIEGVRKEITTRQNTYTTEVSNLNQQKKVELYSKKNEYYHPEYPNGISKENFAKIQKMEGRTKEKAEYLYGKKFEMKISDPSGYGQLDIAEQNPEGMGLIPWEPDQSLFNKEEYEKLKNDVKLMELGDWEKFNKDIPSKYSDVESIDYEMLFYKKEVQSSLEQVEAANTYMTELESVKAAFGYEKPEKVIEKPWNKEFWEDWDGKENPFTKTVDWLDTWDIHDVLILASLTAIMIPGLQGVGLAMNVLGIESATALGLGLTEGALLSAAIDLVDAGIYLTEGNVRMAGLSLLFAVLPFIIESGVIKSVFKESLQSAKEAIRYLMSIPDVIVKSATSMTMKELLEYTKTMLKPEVQAALKLVAEKSSEIFEKMQKSSQIIFEKAKKTLNSTTLGKTMSTTLNFSAKGFKTIVPPLLKLGITFEGFMATGKAYHTGVDYYLDIAGTPKSIVEGLIGKNSWELVKNEFMSDGGSFDNTLLKNAVINGWRPGMIVPIEFQTKKYKLYLESQKKKSSENLNLSLTPELEEKIKVMLDDPKATKTLIKEKLDKKNEEIKKFGGSVKVVTDGEFEDMLERARKEVQEESQINQNGDNINQNESTWVKFLNKNFILN